MPTPSRSNVFGVSLEELMGFDGEKGGIPKVVKDCIQYIRDTSSFLVCCLLPATLYVSLGMEEEGLFRRSPSLTMLKQAQEAYDRGIAHIVPC
jgi:Rho GTPase-activating protein 1